VALPYQIHLTRKNRMMSADFRMPGDPPPIGTMVMFDIDGKPVRAQIVGTGRRGHEQRIQAQET
jgi:hypothetical protein